MGSLRNPVGPLPSTIYWRRRVILACLCALVVAVVAWVVASGGGGGKGKGRSAPAGSHTPVASITPGPDPSGTHISGRPGGRDTAPPASGSSDGGTGDGSSGGSTPSAGDTPADGGTTGTASDAGATAGQAGGSAGGSGGSGTAGGGTGGSGGTAGLPPNPAPLAASSTLPDCAPGSVQVTLSSVSNSYSPGDVPAFQLKAVNSGSVSCRIDVGPRSAVLTVTATDNHHVWATNDCPATGSYPIEVPAGSSATYTVRWNEKTSSPQCAAPKGQSAPAGTYLVQSELAGYPARQVSFVLSAD
ncbi:hypothetical protein [Actinacidiphila acididurans]|uniref:Uncharacterized protein n=1 Tax=Actinacidiphila acididurans TaxID=2784346 RepID=A0ABS2U040_9ACTN|nr:hypothetical protein [Actinacidiphila acididurans]MBM9508576.1 hypothetical protein [Actinacidiphila acididurans]